MVSFPPPYLRGTNPAPFFRVGVPCVPPVSRRRGSGTQIEPAPGIPTKRRCQRVAAIPLPVARPDPRGGLGITPDANEPGEMPRPRWAFSQLSAVHLDATRSGDAQVTVAARSEVISTSAPNENKQCGNGGVGFDGASSCDARRSSERSTRGALPFWGAVETASGLTRSASARDATAAATR